MRSIILLASCLALAGCADITARQQILGERGPQYLARLHDLTLAPYLEWQQEHPTNCRSSKLLDARASVISTSWMIKPERDGFEATYDAAEWMLEVADGAAAQGCAAVALELYYKVRARYTGPAYQGLRGHASAAIEHLRT